MGFCLQLGLHDKAIEDYTRALEVDPANSFAYYNRGITKDRMGDFTGAVADFSSAIALDHKNADFYHNKGFSLRKQVSCIVQKYADQKYADPLSHQPLSVMVFQIIHPSCSWHVCVISTPAKPLAECRVCHVDCLDLMVGD